MVPRPHGHGSPSATRLPCPWPARPPRPVCCGGAGGRLTTRRRRIYALNPTPPGAPPAAGSEPPAAGVWRVHAKPARDGRCTGPRPARISAVGGLAVVKASVVRHLLPGTNPIVSVPLWLATISANPCSATLKIDPQVPAAGPDRAVVVVPVRLDGHRLVIFDMTGPVDHLLAAPWAAEQPLKCPAGSAPGIGTSTCEWAFIPIASSPPRPGCPSRAGYITMG